MQTLKQLLVVAALGLRKKKVAQGRASSTKRALAAERASIPGWLSQSTDISPPLLVKCLSTAVHDISYKTGSFLVRNTVALNEHKFVLVGSLDMQ